MTYILCIETTSTNCSVAIAAENGGYPNNLNIAHCKDLLEDQSVSYNHGERLHVFIEQILKKHNLKAKDLDAVAISSGPGSYTGLRIGVASAKGMCYALDIPLISIDTLQSLSYTVPLASKVIIPMIDARRMEVYTTVLVDRHPVEPTTATILEQNTFSGYLKKGNVSIIGSGAQKFKELLGDQTNCYESSLPTALTMCDLAILAYKKSDIVDDIAYYEPLYLKEFSSN